MDFALPPELDALAAEARELGEEWAARSDIAEESWIVGHDVEVAKALSERGWLGMTWPVEHGGGGRSKLERFVVYEALISAGAPIAASWFADRQIGPTNAALPVQRKLTLGVQDTIFASMRGQDAANIPLEPGGLPPAMEPLNEHRHR